MKAGRAVILLVATLAWPLGALAHTLKLSDSDLTLDGNRATWEHKVHIEDFNVKFGRIDRQTLQGYLPQRLGLSAGGAPCRFERVAVAENPTVEAMILNFQYECPNSGLPIAVHYDLFYGDLNHRHLMKLHAAGKDFNYTFAPGKSDVEFAGDGLGQSIRNFLKLGLEHILIGYDHILFVLTLIFGAKRFRDLFWLITSFTLAHSVTLALATLEIVSLPPTVVEPLIAASIVFLAIQDLLASGPGTPRNMIFLTFGFGLIHGLGFSYVLQEANLRAGHLAVPLIFFNLGVELGQALIVSLVYPLALGLGRLLGANYLWLKRALLTLIAGTGLYWMVERLFFG